MKKFMSSDFNLKDEALAFYVKAGTGMQDHRNRPNHGLAIFPGGKRVYNFGNKKLRVNKNCIVYFPKGSDYSINVFEHYDCYAINFDFSDEYSFEPFVFEIKHSENYLPHFKNANKLSYHPEAPNQHKIKAELYEIIYKMQTEYANTSNKKRNSIETAIEYIHNNFLTQNIPIPHLAEMCGFSEVYLRKVFSREFGVSPNKYIINLRLQHAEQLLLSGFYKVTEVCFMSGFNDESYFNREFKKHFGKTPGEYAKTTHS